MAVCGVTTIPKSYECATMLTRTLTNLGLNSIPIRLLHLYVVTSPVKVRLPSKLPSHANARSEELFKRVQVHPLTINPVWPVLSRQLELLEDPSKLEGALIYTRGKENIGKDRCVRCQVNHGPFPAGVVIGKIPSCTSCVGIIL